MPDLPASLTGPMVSAEFHQLFGENQRRVFAYILTALPRIDDAHEVFQSTCVVIFNKADQYVPGTDFAKWACQIANYEVCNYRRKRQRELLILDNEVLDSLASKQLAALEDSDRRRAALNQCLSRLRKQDRELIEARYRRNVTAKQLASELSRPQDTVYKALARVRRRLRKCIERTLASEDRAYG